ncbi:hypothetical protein ACQRIU_000369 [Beauveria bassiana]
MYLRTNVSSLAREMLLKNIQYHASDEALIDDTVDQDDHEQRQLSNKAYVVGWICALETEYVAAQAFLDEKHAPPESVATNDNNDYTLGRIGKHNTVIAVLPGGEYGTAAAATVARDMLHSFTNVRIGLMVGIGGGAPNAKHDIRLGDVVVSVPQNGLGGVLQYDFGKEIQDQPFHVTRCLAPPPPVLLTAVSGLRSAYKINGHDIQNDIRTRLAENKRLRREFNRPDAETDRLYHSHVVHPVSDCECTTSCGTDAALMVQRVARDQDDDDDPTVHYGLIASANRLMKNAELRDQYANQRDILCFEMEAGGLNSHFPCLVIRGICDYADTHKNQKWQGYGAMTAAAYAKDLLRRIPANKLEAEKELSKQVEHVQASVQSLHTSSHLDKITNWISAPDPSTDLNKARQLHQPGTGQLLLLSEQYQLWKTARNSFLWLYGIPGCGKTVLSSTAITDLCDDEETSPNLVYFYFNFADVEKRSTEKAVRSLIDQLYRKCTPAQGLLNSFYAPYQKAGGEPSEDALQEILQAMMQECGEVWLVLDGLDECETRSQNAVGGIMPWIQKLRDVNSRCGFLGTALQAASYQGHLDTVNVLLEYGARVNEQGGHYGNALQAASIAGHEAIVRRLMQEGADVNRQSSHYEIKSALIAASKCGHAAIVQMLLEYGADVNAPVPLVHDLYSDNRTMTGSIPTALVAASSQGHGSIVHMLIQAGADVNLHGGNADSALMAAVIRGNEAIVQLLVDNGAVRASKRTV